MSTEEIEFRRQMRMDPDVSRLYDRLHGIAAGIAFAASGPPDEEIQWFVRDAELRKVDAITLTVREAMLKHPVLADMVFETERELTSELICDFDSYWEGLAEGILSCRAGTDTVEG